MDTEPPLLSIALTNPIFQSRQPPNRSTIVTGDVTIRDTLRCRSSSLGRSLAAPGPDSVHPMPQG